MKRARSILDIVFLLILVFNVIYWFVLPDRVAINFGWGGAPDRWASKGTHILKFLGIMALLYAGSVLSSKLLDAVPRRFINIPNRDYWLLDENKPEAIRRMTGLMYSFGIATGLLMLSVSVLSVAANLSDPVMLNERISFLLFFAYIAYTIWWIVKLLSEFKVPER